MIKYRPEIWMYLIGNIQYKTIKVFTQSKINDLVSLLDIGSAEGSSSLNEYRRFVFSCIRVALTDLFGRVKTGNYRKCILIRA